MPEPAYTLIKEACTERCKEYWDKRILVSPSADEEIKGTKAESSQARRASPPLRTCHDLLNRPPSLLRPSRRRMARDKEQQRSAQRGPRRFQIVPKWAEERTASSRIANGNKTK